MQAHFGNSASQRKHIEWLVLIVVLIIIGALLTGVQLSEVNRVNASERDRLRVLTNVVASNIEGSLTTVNRSLEGVSQDFLVGPGAIRASSNLSLRLRALQTAIQGIRVFVVLDAKGVVTATSEPITLGQDLSFRDYFKAARDRPSTTTLYVSAPLTSLLEKHDRVITVSRMVPGPHGEFAGLVVATLGNAYFSGSFSPVSYAPDFWGGVVHGDGMQVMSFPERNDIAGVNLNRPGTFFNQHHQSGRIESVLTGRGHTTGEDRLVVLQTIQPAGLNMDKPLVIMLSRKLNVIAAPLRRQAVLYGLLYAIVALLCAGGLYWRQRRRAHLGMLAAAREKERQEIEDQIRLSEALRQSESRFRILIEDAPLAIAILRGGYFIYTNPRYRKLHGYSAEDDLSGLPWSAMITSGSRAALCEQERLIIGDSPVEQKFEAQGLGKEGSVVPVFKTTARVMLVDGPATLIFAQDISAQKHAELALLQARDAAEAANRSKADFLANMSHEIRSPLNAVLGLAYLLEHAPLDPDAHSMVRKIRSSGSMLLGIVNDILDVSKIEAGQLSIEQAPFRLDDVMSNVATTMGIMVGNKDIELIIRPLPPGISSVMGDSLRLEQILSNLTSNAIKFTQQGHVELRVTVLSQFDDTMTLRFDVLDTGMGIATELQSEIFLPFMQADNSTTRRFGGTGLGLTICRQLVNLLGGEIGLNSTLGQGSDFWFTLPLKRVASTYSSSSDRVHLDALIADANQAKPQAPTDMAPALGWRVGAARSDDALAAQVFERTDEELPLTEVRVLIVDDSEINRDLAQRILSEQGAKVSLAVDGKAALEWLSNHPDEVDLVLMDVQMPVMDGIEATRQLRQMPQFNDLPVVALTAGAFKVQQDAARAAGMTHFISKPFDVPSTIALIQQINRKKTQGDRDASSPVSDVTVDHANFEPSRYAAVIDIVGGVKIWGDLETYRDYLWRFVDSYSNAVDTINASLAAGDRPAAAALAHKLAGVSGNFALPDTRRLAVEAERALSTEHDASLILIHLGNALKRAIETIERIAPRTALQPLPTLLTLPTVAALSGDISPESRGTLESALIELLAALDSDSPVPAKPILEKLSTTLPLQALIGVRACIHQFDFRGAEVATVKLGRAYGIILEE